MGEGREPIYPSLGDDMICLSDEMVSSSTGPEELITEIFGSDPTMLRNVDFMSSRAILGARNVDVDTINDLAAGKFPGKVCLEPLPQKLPN